MEKRPVLRNLLALGRRLSPQARFLLNRLTPGGLGLEFTTALAALAVGSYVVIAYALVVGDSPGPTTGDSTAADFVEQIRTGWLTSLAKVITCARIRGGRRDRLGGGRRVAGRPPRLAGAGGARRRRRSRSSGEPI